MKEGQLGGGSNRGREGERSRRQKKVTIEGIEEQRAFYTRAKRHEGAMPDLAGLNPKRQRTGTFFTYKICNLVALFRLAPSSRWRTPSVHNPRY